MSHGLTSHKGQLEGHPFRIESEYESEHDPLLNEMRATTANTGNDREYGQRRRVQATTDDGTRPRALSSEYDADGREPSDGRPSFAYSTAKKSFAGDIDPEIVGDVEPNPHPRMERDRRTSECIAYDRLGRAGARRTKPRDTDSRESARKEERSVATQSKLNRPQPKPQVRPGTQAHGDRRNKEHRPPNQERPDMRGELHGGASRRNIQTGIRVACDPEVFSVNQETEVIAEFIPATDFDAGEQRTARKQPEPRFVRSIADRLGRSAGPRSEGECTD